MPPLPSSQLSHPILAFPFSDAFVPSPALNHRHISSFFFCFSPFTLLRQGQQSQQQQQKQRQKQTGRPTTIHNSTRFQSQQPPTNCYLSAGDRCLITQPALGREKGIAEESTPNKTS
jgi:hypothetical protein